MIDFYHVLQVDEWVIDGHNLHLLGGDSSTGHQTTNAAKSEETKFYFLVGPQDGNLLPHQPACSEQLNFFSEIKMKILKIKKNCLK